MTRCFFTASVVFASVGMVNCWKQKAYGSDRAAAPPLHASVQAPFPGSSALTFGYSILEGNPLTSAADPGWRTEPVYEVNCAGCLTNETFDGWVVQDGVKIRELEDCSYASSSVTISDGQTFQHECSKTVSRSEGFDIILAGLEFSSSVFTHKVERLTVGGRTVLTVGTGQCAAYRVSMDPTAFSFELTADFKAALASLPSALNATTLPAFLKFVQTFGTHLPSSVDLGAFASQQALFSGANFSMVEAETESVNVAASASLLIFFGADISIGGGYSFSDYLTFAVSASSNETLCKPACPPSSKYAGVDPSVWRTTLGFPTQAQPDLVSPVPIAATMVPLPLVVLSSAIPSAVERGSVSDEEAGRLTSAAQLLLEYMNTTLCSQVPGCGKPPTVPAEVQFPASLPTPAAGASVATVQADGQNALVVVGGASAVSSSATVSASVGVLDLGDVSAGWVNKADAPEPLALAGTAAVPGNESSELLIVAGGMVSGGSVSNKTWSFDAVRGVWEPGTPLMHGRLAPAAAFFEGVVVVLGGENASAVPTPVIECLSVSSSGMPAPTSCPSSLAQSKLPEAVSGASAVVLPSPYTSGASMLVVSGGCTKGSILAQACSATSSSVWFTDSKATAWTSLSPLPEGRYGHALLVDSSQAIPALLVTGGFELSAPSAPTSAIFRASLEVAAWEAFAWPNPWPPAFASHATLPDSVTPATLCVGGLNTTLPGGQGDLGPSSRISLFRGGIQAHNV